jgi:hypothetical protein
LSVANILTPQHPPNVEAVYNHLIALSYQNDPKSDPLANDLMRSLSSTGINLILNATGEQEKIVCRCTTILTQKDAINCVETKNKGDWRLYFETKIRRF